MGLLFILFEIIIVGILAKKLSAEAHDKGYNNILFMALAVILWIGTRILGNFIGYVIFKSYTGSLLVGWLAGIVSYSVFYFILWRIPEEDLLHKEENDSWKNFNSVTPTETEKREEK